MMKRHDRHIPQHSFAAVVNAFMASDKFKRLAKSTQNGYARYLRLAGDKETLGGLSIMEVRPSVVQQFLDGLSHIPGGQERAKVASRAWNRGP